MLRKKSRYQYIYGPVPSWRLGRSLGVDVIASSQKTCSFDCIYCQIGKTKTLSGSRRIFVPTKNIIHEIKKLKRTKADYITLSGNGEPTLAKNLGDIIREIRNAKFK